MKLYEEDGYIYLDYTDVDPEARLNIAANEYKNFILECRYEYGIEWDVTLKSKVKQYNTRIDRKLNDCGAMGGLSWLLKQMQYFVKYGHGVIEVDESFNEFQRKVDERYKELYRAETERRQAEAAQRMRSEYWKRLCKNGCGKCENLRCIGDDDYECGVTGDSLEVRNMPEYRGKVYQLFNYIPFPTDDCPFNTNKTKETDYEHLREYYGSSG